MTKVFISYRREDTAPYAGRIADFLRINGHEIFFDVDGNSIPLGSHFPDTIKQAIASCDTMLVLIGRGWLFARDEAGRRRIDKEDDFVRREIAEALAANVHIIPILVSGAAMPGATDLPQPIAPLSLRQGIELTDHEWGYGIGRLMAGISGAATRQPTGRALLKASVPRLSSPSQQFKVIVAFSRNLPQEELRRIRQWCWNEDRIRIDEYPNDLGKAAETLLQNQSRSLLITLDLDPAAVKEALHQQAPTSEVIISPPPNYPTKDYPSASLIARSTWRIACDPIPFLRKSLVRLKARTEGYTIRRLQSESDFHDYAALRYDVWESLQYLAAHKVTATRWEIDYTDRTALPLGLFAQDGQMAGCVRLVGGREVTSCVSTLQRLLSQQADGNLAANFQFPSRWTRPFDVLEVFPGFASYYRQLITQHISHGELSRVIVHPDHRGKGLGEVLVDSLISLARAEQVARLFLACRMEHQGFYQLSGFSAIPNLTSDRFGAINAPSLAMQREVTRYPFVRHNSQSRVTQLV